jgi:hypothetical protein
VKDDAAGGDEDHDPHERLDVEHWAVDRVPDFAIVKVFFGEEVLCGEWGWNLCRDVIGHAITNIKNTNQVLDVLLSVNVVLPLCTVLEVVKKGDAILEAEPLGFYPSVINEAEEHVSVKSKNLN